MDFVDSEAFLALSLHRNGGLVDEVDEGCKRDVGDPISVAALVSR